MRIVAGTLRGRLIHAPDGKATRPTTDRVREALFSSLYSLCGDLEGAVVLDAFAGSGALGLEALSRGAKRAVFFERDPKACEVLRKNVKACKAEASADVRNADVLQATPSSKARPFDLVFLDPPYDMEPDAILTLISSLMESGALSAEALVVYEHAQASVEQVGDCAAKLGLSVVKVKKYGKTSITILRPETGESDRRNA